MRQHLHEFLRFCTVGVVGYGVDAGLLEVFVGTGLVPAIARLISIALAIQCTYALHGIFTYRGHGGHTRRSWLTFMATNSLGAAMNYGIFLLALQLLNMDSPLANRQLALVCGTAVAMGFNHWANRRFVFRRP